MSSPHGAPRKQNPVKTSAPMARTVHRQRGGWWGWGILARAMPSCQAGAGGRTPLHPSEHSALAGAMLGLIHLAPPPWTSISTTAPSGAMCHSPSGATSRGAIRCSRDAFPIGSGDCWGGRCWLRRFLALQKRGVGLGGFRLCQWEGWTNESVCKRPYGPCGPYLGDSCYLSIFP